MKKLIFILLNTFICCVHAQEKSALILTDIHLNLDTLYKNFDGADADTISFINALKSIDNSISFEYVLIPGDFIFHSLVHTDSCVSQTLNYIRKEIHQRFPAAIIMPAVGNNDLRLHNTPEDKTYGLFYNSLLKDLDADGNMRKTFLSGGYYAYKHNDATIIELNTMLFEKKSKEGDEEMAWFAEQLLKCRNNVWILYHIPPGINSYPKLTKNSNQEFWDSAYKNEYLELVIRNGNYIPVPTEMR